MNQFILCFASLLWLCSCASQPLSIKTAIPTSPTTEPTSPPKPTSTRRPLGCQGQPYPEPADSPYVLPFAIGESYTTGLTNCSSSYHAAGNHDQYAFDFDMPEGTSFIAARAGTVVKVINDQPSNGGGNGNYVLIDHGDDTFAYYLHSPKEGITVELGDKVKQGDILGITGRSGLAGYPHLHFIVVQGDPAIPYSGVAISFRNAQPADKILQSDTVYEAGE